MWQSNKLLISTAALKDTVCNLHVHEHAEYLYSYISSHQIPIISQCWHSLPHQFSSGSREALHLNWLLLVWVSNDDLRDAHGTHEVGPPPCVCGLQCSTSQQAQATLLWEKEGKGGGSTMTLLAVLVKNRHCYAVLTCTEHWSSLHWLHSAHISCIASYWLNHPVMKLHSKLHGRQKSMCHSKLFHLMHTLKEPYKHSTYICVHICYRTDRWATVLPLHQTPQRAYPFHYHPH